MVELKEAAVAEWLRQKLLEKQAAGQHFSQLRLIVEIEPDYMEEVQAALLKLDVRVIDKAFNFIRVEAPPELIDEIARIPHVKRVSYDMPVKALALPLLPSPIFPLKDPLVGKVRISEVEIPPERVGPDLILPFSPLRTLLFFQYRYIPMAKVRELLVDRPELGLTGEGVKLAVLDTGGPSPGHPQVRLRAKYHSTCMMDPFPGDGCGHGAWCLTAAGGLEFTAPLGKVHGIAPGCELISIKVLSSAGTGSMMDVIKGMELAMKLGARVVSMSLGAEECQGCYEPDGGPCPNCVAVKMLADKGILPVIAAGNSGPEDWTTCCPGCSQHGLTVGSYSLTDSAPAYFSSRGPQNKTNRYKMFITDETMKPDCVSYGGGRVKKDLRPDEIIYSGCEGWIDGIYSGFKHGHEAMHGTSMATPEAAGLMALWLEAERVKNVYDAKRILSDKGVAKNKDVGWGLVKLSWAF